VVTRQRDDWVFLTYRLPREPSAPRLSLWRAIRRLGAVQLADGLVALPHSARNLEHFQWLAAEIAEDGGNASVWHARADSRHDHDAHVAVMREAVETEYQAVRAEAEGVPRDVPDAERRRIVRRLRGHLRRIGSRDHFAAPGRAVAEAVVDRLASQPAAVEA
jgi:hypothetical protein